MRAYITRRLLLIIPTLFLVTLIAFFTIRLVPGDVIDQIVSQHIFGSTADAELTAAVIRAELGLDVPVHIQYVRWMERIILHGDLGTSLWRATPVLDEILVRLPVSMELGIIAIIFSQLIALPIGTYSAIRQDTWGDYVGRSIAIAFIALPGFWVATVIIVFPSIWWAWMPSIDYVPFLENPAQNLDMFIIPAFILGMQYSGITMRMTRTMMLEVLRQDYIRTAWAKGLTERTVIIRHGLKNALIPVVTIVGVQMPVVIAGAVVTETIFAIPGIGRLLIESISSRDYTIIAGLNLVIASFVLLLNLSVDLTYAWLDPRVHYK